MPRSFDWRALTTRVNRGGARLRLKVAAIALAVANLIALLLYLFPPGGSREELAAQGQQLRTQIEAARLQAVHLKNVAGKVQLGGDQSTEFESKYLLPKRLAYEAVIAEIQRMSKAANMVERDGVFTEEPIEGTDDLSLLNMTANYQGTYPNLLKFLYEADHSPMLLMLDQLQASPQKSEQINVSIRFQAIVREEITAPAMEVNR